MDESTVWLHEWFDARPKREWYREAACAGQPWQDFFARSSRRVYREFCKRCPVNDDCLVYALRVEMDLLNGRGGMYGGTTAEERHNVGRTLKAAGITIGDSYRSDLRTDR